MQNPLAQFTIFNIQYSDFLKKNEPPFYREAIIGVNQIKGENKKGLHC
jgi:hypothetical protein